MLAVAMLAPAALTVMPAAATWAAATRGNDDGQHASLCSAAICSCPQSFLHWPPWGIACISVVQFGQSARESNIIPAFGMNGCIRLWLLCWWLQ
eukprot:11730943-Alexandrium_andersonii.AAC.1